MQTVIEPSKKPSMDRPQKHATFFLPSRKRRRRPHAFYLYSKVNFFESAVSRGSTQNAMYSISCIAPFRAPEGSRKIPPHPFALSWRTPENQHPAIFLIASVHRARAGWVGFGGYLELQPNLPRQIFLSKTHALLKARKCFMCRKRTKRPRLPLKLNASLLAPLLPPPLKVKPSPGGFPT